MADMYFTMLPLMLGGVVNMIFTKTALYRRYRRPMDGGKCCRDGKRLFGDNKTWVGFFSMILFCTLLQLLFGLLCRLGGLEGHCDYYRLQDNTLSYNLLIGFLTGLVYMLSELPNSFLKRRLNIADGKTEKGRKGRLFFVIDQIDSLVGVMLLVYLFSGIPLTRYFLYVVLGGITHIAINAGLYRMKVRKNL